LEEENARLKSELEELREDYEVENSKRTKLSDEVILFVCF
jgi:hypothetical protein